MKERTFYNYVMEKACPMCLVNKAFCEFDTDTRCKSGLFPICTTCRISVENAKNEKIRQREAAKRERRAAIDSYWVTRRSIVQESSTEATRRRTMKKYGLTLEDFDLMLIDQEYKCAICFCSVERNPVLDHCHSTGRVRGILCRSCNSLLGFAKDDISILLSAMDYLSK